MSAIQTKGSPPLIILFSYSALGRLTHRSKRNLPCSPSHGSSPRAQERIIDGPARPMVPGSNCSAGSIIKKDNFYNVNRVWVWQHDCACKHLEVCRGPIAQVRFRARYILHSVNLYHNLSHLARQSRPFRSRKTCTKPVVLSSQTVHKQEVARVVSDVLWLEQTIQSRCPTPYTSRSQLATNTCESESVRRMTVFSLRHAAVHQIASVRLYLRIRQRPQVPSS